MSALKFFHRKNAFLAALVSTCAVSLQAQTPVSDTDRDRALLERIDRLERRVEELQTKLDQVNPQRAPAVVTEAAAPPPPATASAPPPSEPAASQPNTNAKPQPAEPFSFADFTWLTGNSRTTESPLDTKVFTGELRIDTDYVYDFNHPADHSIGGSSEIFRSGEVQLTQFGVGGDFHWNSVRGRLMTQFGMYSETTPRNDASPARGQWDLDTAYRYISEAYGGYHFNKLNGINVNAGIFMSYVGLFSYYQFDNWAYQPSYVSSNTPWFFNGVRVQVFSSEKLKIEPWFVNGWQSYGTFNKAPGFGLQILYRPNGWLSILGNQYTGTDTLGIPGRRRVHTDDSVQIKYYDKPGRFLDKAAMTITIDAGCEFGSRSGVSCVGGNAKKPSQYFLGFMSYQRFWFHRDLYAVTLGGGAINNPGRYLVLLPPINGATAIPQGSTALVDTIYCGLDAMRSAHRSRKALLIISDGMDNHSRYSKPELMERIVESDVRDLQQLPCMTLRRTPKPFSCRSSVKGWHCWRTWRKTPEG